MVVEVAASLFVATKTVGWAVAVVVAVLAQQFLPMERCPLTLVVFLTESGPDVPLHCMLPQT